MKMLKAISKTRITMKNDDVTLFEMEGLVYDYLYYLISLFDDDSWDKVRAIKFIRSLLGTGLKESKQIVEAIWEMVRYDRFQISDANKAYSVIGTSYYEINGVAVSSHIISGLQGYIRAIGLPAVKTHSGRLAETLAKLLPQYSEEDMEDILWELIREEENRS